MKKLIFYVLIISMILGCKKEDPAGKNSLVKFEVEPQGINCYSGGYKVVSGIDLNNNNILDTNEIKNIQYICNGNDGAYDKQIRINFPASGLTFATFSTNGNVESILTIFNFDIKNYMGIDSIVFGSYLKVERADATCTVELYDKTNDLIINNTLLNSNATMWEWKTTSVNFLNNLPKTPIDLAIKVKTNIEGISVYYFSPMIILYRK